MDYEVSPPGASAMLESLRAYGYSLDSAIADLIDNSITANAKNIWITLSWDGPGSWITIADDGEGMDEATLRQAMKAGSQNPLAPREKNDLGRFGLGLKTASLSQSRSLTVASRINNFDVNIRRWDLDYISGAEIDEWRLLKSARDGSAQHIEELEDFKSGTIILLENLDKLCMNTKATSTADRDNFYHRIDSLQAHLAMTFQRFLTGPKRLKIFINGHGEANLVKPWDPFCTNSATELKPDLPIPYGDKYVAVKGYVLPHKDLMTPDEYEAAAGPAGWNAQQGFYIYRNDRLLVGGSWLGLREGSRKWRMEEHYKLARIQIDITNDMDTEWQIDVKKSVAIPPPNVALALASYASKVRKEAREVYAHRGRYGKRAKGTSVSKIWSARQRNGMNTYRLDRDHPLLSAFLTPPGTSKKDAETLFRLIEETVPVEQIWLDSAETPELRASPFHGATEKEIIKAAEQSLSIMCGSGPSRSREEIDLICGIECFVDHQDLLYAHFGV
jgi:hypothetical protein